MIKRLLLGCITFLVLFVLSHSTNAKVLKIATLSPEGSSWMITMRAAAKAVEKETQSRVKFKFYPGGVMGDDKAVLKKIRFGQLQGAAVAGGSLNKFFSDAQIYSIPLKFTSFDEVDYVRKHLDKVILEGLEKGGFVSFGLGEGGLAYLMSDTQIGSIEQLRKKKVWVPSDDSGSYTAVKTFGVSPIPLSLVDVLPSLQTGLINTVATSPIAAIALQWHTQVQYLTDLPLIYFYALLAVEKKHFNKISPQDQKIVRRIMTAAFVKIDKQNRKDNISALAALQKQGISVTQPTAAEITEWRKTGAMAEKALVSQGVISTSISKKLDQLLNDFKSSKKISQAENDI